MPVYRHIVFFSSSLDQVARQPDFIACAPGAFGENLEFPLTCGHFGVDAFYVQASLKTHIEVFFDNLATVGVIATNGAVVWSLWCRETFLGKTQRLVGIDIHQEVFLLKAKPEVIIVFFNSGTAV